MQRRNLEREDHVIVWGLTGLGVMVLLLFIITQTQGQPGLKRPVDGNVANQTKDKVTDRPIEGSSKNPARPAVPHELTGMSSDQMAISDNMSSMLAKSFAPVLDAIVRVQPDPVPAPGTDVEVFGITNASSASRSTFELFGPDCPEDPCAALSDIEEISPPTHNGSIPDGLCNNASCKEYSVMFAGEFFPNRGDYRIKATFFDSDDNVIAMKVQNFSVLSFFR